MEVNEKVQEAEAVDQEWLRAADKKRKTKRTCMIILCVVLGLLVAAAAAAVIVWMSNEFTLEVNLLGDEKVVLEYGDSFTDPGAEAVFYGSLIQREPVEVSVTTTGEVNTEIVGTYKLTYQAVYQFDYFFGQLEFVQSGERVVVLQDTQAPEITLVSSPEVYTIPGDEYVEEGYSAIDNYDGDLTEQVDRNVEEGKVYYSVADSSGNETEVIREIVYFDPIPPVLTLEGQDVVNMTKGEEYKEPGYTAEDNCDGDITDWVVVSGELNTDKVGTYELTYTVKDSYDNTVTLTRTVKVHAPVIIEVPEMPDMPMYDPETPVTPNGKVIYLTFDDGPSAHTERLLNVLDAYGVKATFFVVDTGYAHLFSRMAASGHTVAMHSATHNYDQIYSSENAYFDDLYRMQSIIQGQTGVAPSILRFPGGSSNTVSGFNPGIMTRLSKQLKSMGYRYFDWNVDSRDVAGAFSVSAVYQNVINGVSGKNTSFVLQHDTMGASVDAVESIIRWGLANGYTFLPLTASSPACEHNINN